MVQICTVRKSNPIHCPSFSVVFLSLKSSQHNFQPACLSTALASFLFNCKLNIYDGETWTHFVQFYFLNSLKCLWMQTETKLTGRCKNQWGNKISFLLSFVIYIYRKLEQKKVCLKTKRINQGTVFEATIAIWKKHKASLIDKLLFLAARILL